MCSLGMGQVRQLMPESTYVMRLAACSLWLSWNLAVAFGTVWMIEHINPTMEWVEPFVLGSLAGLLVLLVAFVSLR